MPRRGKLRRIRSPDIEVLAAVSRRGVHKSRAGIVSDMIAGKKRHGKIVATHPLQRMVAVQSPLKFPR